jgi:cation diffusion facilitator family transporter
VSAGGGSPLRAIVYAFCANLLIALAKAAAAVVTQSTSMLAEALHSFADTGNQLLLLLGLSRSRRAPDREHPLGYGKVSYFWSFIVAILLFSVGGLFSLFHGWRKLGEDHALERIELALGVLAFSLVLEAWSMRGCLVEVNKVRGARSLWRWLNESRVSELVVVFGEDLAALLGLSVAFVCVLLAHATGDARFDAFGSIFIGVLLVVIAIFLAVRVKSLLIGRSADPDVVAAIERAIAEDPEIEQVFNVITLQIGSQVMLAAKVRLPGQLGLDQACAHLNELERRLKREIPEIGWSFMEPDLED